MALEQYIITNNENIPISPFVSLLGEYARGKINIAQVINSLEESINTQLSDDAVTDVNGVLGPGKTGFHQGKAGLHKKHQGCGHQGPDIIGMGLDQVDQLFVGLNRRGFVSRPNATDTHCSKQKC